MSRIDLHTFYGRYVSVVVIIYRLPFLPLITNGWVGVCVCVGGGGGVGEEPPIVFQFVDKPVE